MARPSQDVRLLKELDGLRGNREVVMPEELVEFAKDPDRAWHSKFEWDNTIAGHAYRLSQARGYLQVFVTLVQPQGSVRPEVSRMFVNLTSAGGKRGYAKTEIVLDDPERRRQLLHNILVQIKGLCESYPLAELKPVLREVKKLL